MKEAVKNNMPRMQSVYLNDVKKKLVEEFGYKNQMEIPKMLKIAVNVGMGESLTNKNAIESMLGDLTLITGQKPVVTKAKLSIANFNLREGMRVGIKVTLRGNEMWDFLLRLIAIALPNIRDFRGVPSKLDGNGNYTLGITDHSIFPEINVERQRVNTGMDICIVTSANSDQEGVELLKLLGMPFRKHSSEAKAEQAA